MASVLETFYFLFKSNADDVDKGNEKAKQSSDQLEDAIERTGDTTKETSKSIVGMASALGHAVGGLLAFSVIQAQIRDSIALTEELRLTGMAISENVGDIDAWGRASRRFGGDAQTLQATLKNLNNNIREAAFTGEGSMSPALRRLGLNLRTANGDIKTTLQLLPEIATAFERITAPEAMFLGEQLGLDQATILLLKSGKANLDQLIESQKRFGVVTQQDALITKKLKDQMADTSNVFLSLRQRLAMAATPALIIFFEKLETIGEWLVDNRSLVEGFFIGAAAAITAYLLPAVVRLAAATLAATWPILAIGAVIAGVAAGFAILYDEITAFSNGQDSLIGEAVKKWPILGGIIKIIVNEIKDLITAISFLSELAVYALTDPLKIFELFGRHIENVEARVNSLKNTLLAMFNVLKSFPLMSSLAGLLQGKSLFEVSAEQSPSTAGSLDDAKTAISMAASNPIASQTSNSVISSALSRGDNSVAIENVNIQTQATDADGISSAIGTSLTDNLRSLLFNFDDGVRT